MLIEIEGIDGAGKTVQCKLLQEFLGQCKGIDAIILKELTGTELGVKLKELLTSNAPKDAKAEVFSFLAAKAQLYVQILSPALNEGKWVIADRGSLSFLSYCHIIARMEIRTLRELMNIATGPLRPDITIVVDVPAETSTARMGCRENLSYFDQKGEKFFDAQRRVFKELCHLQPNCVIIDGTLSTEEVHTQVKNAVLTIVTA